MITDMIPGLTIIKRNKYRHTTRPSVVSIPFIVGSISATSIPVEFAIVLARETDTDVTIAALYDEESLTEFPEIEAVDVVTLGADSRFDPDAFGSLWTLLRERAVDILHTHQNFLGSAGRVLAALTGAVSVDTEHRAHDSMTTLQNLINAPTLPLSAVVVANSQTTLDSFEGVERLLLELTRTPTRVVHNGVDINRIRAAPSGDPRRSGRGPDSCLCGPVRHNKEPRSASPCVRADSVELTRREADSRRRRSATPRGQITRYRSWYGGSRPVRRVGVPRARLRVVRRRGRVRHRLLRRRIFASPRSMLSATMTTE